MPVKEEPAAAAQPAAPEEQPSAPLTLAQVAAANAEPEAAMEALVSLASAQCSQAVLQSSEVGSALHLLTIAWHLADTAERSGGAAAAGAARGGGRAQKEGGSSCKAEGLGRGNCCT